MPKFFPGLVETETVAAAKAITTPLQDHNKVNVEELNNQFDWVPGATFAEALPNVIEVTAQTGGRLLKVGSHKSYASTLTTSDITTQLGSTSVAVGEKAELKFAVAGLTAGSNVSASISNLETDAIPSGVDVQVQQTIDENGIVVVTINNQNNYDSAGLPVDFVIPELELSVVELLGKK